MIGPVVGGLLYHVIHFFFTFVGMISLSLSLSPLSSLSLTFSRSVFSALNAILFLLVALFFPSSITNARQGHTYTYTHKHTYTHAHIHREAKGAHTHRRAQYTYTHKHMHTCTHIHIYACTYIHSRMHAWNSQILTLFDRQNSQIKRRGLSHACSGLYPSLSLSTVELIHFSLSPPPPPLF